MKHFPLFLSLLLLGSLTAEAPPAPSFDIETNSHETLVSKNHIMSIGSKKLEYESVAGSLITKNQEILKDRANIYFTAYFLKEPIVAKKKRPITFCFNGGPGSSSVWLHMGCMGPKIVSLRDLENNLPPGSYRDNPLTLLSDTDLVFVDPVSTGFSRPVDGVDAKSFHGVDEDINSMAEFIRLFLTHFHRWDSPKFLAGESYGTVRVVGLAQKLEEDYFIDLNGLILISCALDFTTMDENSLGNDLCYILSLPSYAAAAWYHKHLPPEHQNKKLQQFLAEVEEFSLRDYAQGLLLGDKIDPEDKSKLTQKLSEYTGVSQNTITRLHLRIPPAFFLKELLRQEEKVLGRYDARIVGFDSPLPSDFSTYDPALMSIAGLFTDSLQDYMYRDLGLNKESRYYIIGRDVQPWNWSLNKQPAGLGYLNVADSLRATMLKSPNMKIFVASGYYDNATPYFSTDYTLDHLQLPIPLRKNIEQHYYEGGHMMYLNPEALQQMKKELSSFYQESTP